MAVARLASIALDCTDPAPLAAFWAAMVGGEVVFESEHFCAVQAGGVYLAMVAIEDYVPPTWPGGATPKQLPLDLAVTDLDAAEAEALRLGATRASFQEAPDRFLVFLDPAGHPFCLTTQIP